MMRMKATAGFVVGVLGLFVVGAGVLAQGCGGGSSKPCDVGSETCPCTSGGICNAGLTCASMTCVKLGGTDGGAGGATGTGGTTGSADPNVICDGQSAICQKYNECAPALVKQIYGTVAQCTTRFKISCVDAFKAPDSGLTAAAINACAAALPGATCEDLIYRKISACEIKGMRQNGGACGTNEQCQSGYCTQGDQACGVCATYVGAGADCSQTDCEPGLVCNALNHCVLPGGAGMNCNDSQPCKYGLYCFGNACATGAATAGATCADTIYACNTLKGIYCDLSVMKCANLGFAPAGDPCGQVSGKFVVCSAGDCSKPSTTATQGLCGSQAGDGVACDANTGCQDPARCVAGHCKLPSSAVCL